MAAFRAEHSTKEAELLRLRQYAEDAQRHLQDERGRRAELEKLLAKFREDQAEALRRREAELGRGEDFVVRAGPAPVGAGALQRTLDQQYGVIGEMDAEQARLLEENQKLKAEVRRLEDRG